MAGVKGRSGGARPNAGGKRPGAGRKPKTKPPEALAPDSVPTEPSDGQSANSDQSPSDMLQFLQGVALGRIKAAPIQVRAAIAAVQYTHTKRGDGGKKEGQAEAAKKAAGGRFGPAAPPLKLVGKK